jgi:foldase protein PrsA
VGVQPAATVNLDDVKASKCIAAACAALALSACGAGGSPGVAATVNGEDITTAQVTRALEKFEQSPQFDQLAQQSGKGAARRQFEQAYLAQQIRRRVLRPAAERLGVEVSQQEIDQRLEQIKSQFPSQEQFEKALEERKLTQRDLEALLHDQILEETIREKISQETQASEEEVRAHYREQADVYAQTRVQHILVKKLGLAQDIANRLERAPEARVDSLFARLAQKHSTDPSNKNNAGKLGWVSPGSLVAPFEDAMGALSIGEISDPVRTEFGVHVLRVTGRRQRPFSDVADEIQARLSGQAAEEAFGEWLRNAYEEADVVVNPRYGELNPETGEIINAAAEDVPGADESSAETS